MACNDAEQSSCERAVDTNNSSTDNSSAALFELVYERGGVCKPSASVTFTSDFESGNLHQVYQVASSTFVLVLQTDSGSEDYCHWYYFKASAAMAGPVRFHIINLMRPEPLVQEGLRPLALEGAQWVSVGTDIEFAETEQYKVLLPPTSKKCYTLSFTYTFDTSTVWLAYAYPYTYTDLCTYLDHLQDTHADLVSVNVLTHSAEGRPCHLVKVSEPGLKRAVVVTARVHPGETQASYMVKGFLDYIVSAQASLLRKEFSFYVVPMLNPDGVVHGNYRCSSQGLDLNRTWTQPDKDAQPTVFACKQLLRDLVKTDVALFCDFHGHSKLKGAFMYGCSSKKKPAHAIVPLEMSRVSKFFKLQYSHNRIEKCKEATARVAIHRDLKVIHSYTLECSVYGPTRRQSFTQKQIEQIGTDFGRSCKVLLKPKEPAKTTKPSFTRKPTSVHQPLKNSRSRSNEQLKRLQQRPKARLPVEELAKAQQLREVQPKQPRKEVPPLREESPRSREDCRPSASIAGFIRTALPSTRAREVKQLPPGTRYFSKRSLERCLAISVISGTPAAPSKSLLASTGEPARAMSGSSEQSTFKLDSNFNKCRKKRVGNVTSQRTGERLPFLTVVQVKPMF